MRSRGARACLVITALVAAGLPAAARADVFAVYDAPSGDDLDLRMVNTATDADVPLPAGVNTPAHEFHPSVSADGTRLVFQRLLSGGATRIVMADLRSGRQADLFDAFEAASVRPNDPVITPDGTRVLTGRHSDDIYSTEQVDVRAFPDGPFPKTTLRDSTGNVNGVTSFNASLVASGERAYIGLGDDVLFYLGRGSTGPRLSFPFGGCCGAGPTIAPDRGGRVGHPAINPARPRFTVYDDFRIADGVPGSGDLRILDAPDPLDQATLRSLPFPGVNTTVSDESRPAFTSDGRYLGFIRHRDDVDQLLVFDTSSQQFLSGVRLARVDVRSGPGRLSRFRGSVSLFQRPRFTTFQVAPSGVLSAQLLGTANVGILVHRVTGHRRLFGRRVPKLRPVGRVPLGRHGKGRVRIRWDRRVDGRRVRPGRYQVTPRIVTRDVRVRDLGKPGIVRVRRR